jgi:hypothetical protein
MRNKILAIALIVLSPFIYYELSFLFRIKVAFPIMQLFSYKSATLFAAISVSANVICAIITAFVTALPCSYLLEIKLIYIKTLFLIAILCIPAFVFFTQSEYDFLTTADFIGQCFSVLISVYYFANIGYRAAKKNMIVG